MIHEVFTLSNLNLDINGSLLMIFYSFSLSSIMRKGQSLINDVMSNQWIWRWGAAEVLFLSPFFEMKWNFKNLNSFSVRLNIKKYGLTLHITHRPSYHLSSRTFLSWTFQTSKISITTFYLSGTFYIVNCPNTSFYSVLSTVKV